VSWTLPWPLTLDDLEKSYWGSKNFDQNISAKWKDIELKIGGVVGSGPNSACRISKYRMSNVKRQTLYVKYQNMKM